MYLPLLSITSILLRLDVIGSLWPHSTGLAICMITGRSDKGYQLNCDRATSNIYHGTEGSLASDELHNYRIIRLRGGSSRSSAAVLGSSSL